MEKATSRKSKAGKWLTIGRFALLIGGDIEFAVFKQSRSFIQIFWRVYRVGPGIPPFIFARHAAWKN